jgi:V-type H+-transporting ATPase subunit d
MSMGDLVLFNIDDGYAEALLRGFRKGIINDQTYTSLRNTTNLKDFKAVLMETDYMDYIKDYNEQDTSSLKMLLKRKLADEIDQVQSVAGPDLENFLEMTRHRYMIDNVINIVEGAKNKTSTAIIKSRSEPLGFLPEIEGLLNLDVKKIDELYEDVLIDTEVGFYFSKFLEEILMSSDIKNVSTINNYLQELKPENIKNSLKKIWFEHFYHYCQTLNPTTREIMDDLLKFEADCQAIQIVYNSLAYDFSQFQEEERKKVIPNFGYLYPDTTFNIVKASTFEQLKECLRPYPVYYNLIKDVPDPKKAEEFILQSGLKTLDDVMFEESIKKYSIAFEQQFHYACFYSHIKIKEQEIKNIIWLAEMISLDKDAGSKLKKNYILPFNY